MPCDPRRQQFGRRIQYQLWLDQAGGYCLDDGLGARGRGQLDLGVIDVKIYGPLHESEFAIFPRATQVNASISRSFNFGSLGLSLVRATPASRALMMVARISKSIGFVATS